MISSEERQNRIDAARAVLDFIEFNGDLPLPYVLSSGRDWSIYPASKEEFLAAAKLLGTRVEIQHSGAGDVRIRKTFGPMVLGVTGDSGDVRVGAKPVLEVPPLDPLDPEVAVFLSRLEPKAETVVESEA